MHRRCAETARHRAQRVALEIPLRTAGPLVLLAAAALAGCGSAPQVERATEAQVATAGATAAPQEEPLPPEAVQQFDRALVHMSAGDEAAAQQALTALTAAYPDYSGPLLNLGMLHARAGRWREAESALRGAIERNGENAIAHNQLGIVYRHLGRFEDARAAYRRALEIDPGYAIAWLNLGVLCDLYLQQLEHALEAYERYLALAESPDARVNGWVSELKQRLGSDPRAARAE